MSSQNIEQVVENIRKATKGFGTDEKLLISSILSLNKADAEALDTYYKASYGKSVIEVIRSETSGQFGHLLANLCAPEPRLAAETLEKAEQGEKEEEAKVLIN